MFGEGGIFAPPMVRTAQTYPRAVRLCTVSAGDRLRGKCGEGGRQSGFVLTGQLVRPSRSLPRLIKCRQSVLIANCKHNYLKLRRNSLCAM